MQTRVIVSSLAAEPITVNTTPEVADVILVERISEAAIREGNIHPLSGAEFPGDSYAVALHDAAVRAMTRY